MAVKRMKARGASPAHSNERSAGLANAVVTACGLAKVLDIGSGAGRLTEALLRQGVDASGLELDGALVDDANARMPGRFIQGDARAMPFDDGQFEVVVSDGCLECMDEEGLRAALAEIRRVCSRDAILRFASASINENGVARTRAWWERLCFAAGFRKHPRYYRLNPYDSLNHENGDILVALERIPDAALAAYPLSALEEERGLHMDMLRDTGERSDAHVIRYQWACDFIRPNDRVLDAACGLGYGGHVVRALTRASSVTGIDGSEYAVDYANLCYAGDRSRGAYVCGYLPQALHAYPDASFDAVISFETLEHVEDPQGLLKEFERVLTPGGRVIVSVPNDWSDESGEDPNPYHLHVYDLDRLRTEIANDFDVEAAYVQSASQAKVVGQRFVWERKQRELYPVDPQTREPWSAEWWLMVGMKSPFAAATYEERVFDHVAASGHPSVQYAQEYANPWLGLSMITIGQRASSAALRGRYAASVLKQAAAGSADEGAALCVQAYALLESVLPSSTTVDALLGRIDNYIQAPGEGRMVLRWRVSLAYVKAAVLRAQGKLDAAIDAFVACARIDAGAFGVHLLTKTTASWFEAGRLALALGREEQAHDLWLQGLEVGRRLLSVSLDDVLLLPEHPNLFNHGDGIREYALAWDNLARCANGIHLLAAGGEIDVRALDASFANEYEIVTRDQQEGRSQLRYRDVELGTLRSELHDRTLRLENATTDLVSRTDELVSVREILIDRTRQLEDVSAQLSERTRLLEESDARTRALQAELDELRSLLVERTEALDLASRELIDRTGRLESAYAELANREPKVV
ncbi:methyltransferase domain-containing protein [Xanthomonas sp. 1678]|uniref:class I SAM-dependent methyltransferase n=1 Tax=Xanthomonas sp. 1678 TaxID=3158788 RepID=UPI0028667596|nr:SAM-dependent methyltransferase [Xanthomonas translucens]